MARKPGSVVLGMKEMPPSLKETCLASFAELVIKSSERLLRQQQSPVLKWVIRRLPFRMANKYMRIIVEHDWKDWVSLRNVFHFYCTELDLMNTHICPHVWSQVMLHLDVMPYLEVFKIGIPPKGEEDPREDLKLAGERFQEHISNLHYLKHVNVKLSCTPTLLLKLAKHCPLLEELHLTGCPSTFSLKHLKTLKNCRILQTLHLHYCKMSNVVLISIMDALPKLGSLKLTSDKGGRTIDKLILNCTKSFNIKDIHRILMDSTLLVILVEIFPKLTVLRMNQSVDTSLQPINRLHHLKCLSIAGAASERIAELIDITLPRLNTLEVDDCPEFTSALNRELHEHFTQLATLTVTNCEDIDIHAICWVFPNLVQLRMTNCAYAPFDPMIQDDNLDIPALPKLRQMRLIKCIEMKSQHLKFLLSSCMDLESLSIQGCEYLPEMIMMSLVDLKPLKKLKEMYLESEVLTEEVWTMLRESQKCGPDNGRTYSSVMMNTRASYLFRS